MVLYDGAVKPERVLAEYYGIGHFDATAMTNTFRHHGPNDLIILFTSGPNKQWHGWGGFQIYFELSDEIDPDHYVPVYVPKCGGVLESENLYFEWPFNQAKCLWTIPTPPEGKENKITVTEFSVPGKAGIFNLWTDKIMPNNQIGAFSGDEIPTEYASTTSFIIEFTGLDRTIDAYFRLQYVVIDVTPLPDPKTVKGSCVGNFTALQGYIASPNWPEYYPSDSDCNWVINAADHEVIEISFLILE